MKKKFSALFVLAVLAAALVISSGCDALNNGSPTGPSNGKNPLSDQSRYEPLPATKRLVDSEGKEIKMWAKLISVFPPRGSQILVRPAGNYEAATCFPDSTDTRCFRLTMELGFDGASNPLLESTTSDKGFFSVGPIRDTGEGRREGQNLTWGSAQIPGEGGVITFNVPALGVSIPGYWDFAPTHIGVSGRYPRNADDWRVNEKGRGEALFELDYGPK